MVLDSLDDSHCLQGRLVAITEDMIPHEPDEQDRAFLASVLEDTQLHALLEVSHHQLFPSGAKPLRKCLLVAALRPHLQSSNQPFEGATERRSSALQGPN
jgi:hypothetical protein